jgi:microcin C transport system substrate-binding protein
MGAPRRSGPPTPFDSTTAPFRDTLTLKPAPLKKGKPKMLFPSARKTGPALFPAPVAAILIATLSFSAPVVAQQSGQNAEPVWYHAGALVGEPKYPRGFARFDYVNPDAPKGGEVRLSDLGSFDTFNFFIPQGELVAGLGLIYDSLMTSSLDEVSTDYGQLASEFTFPEDFSSATYRLKTSARWNDGVPVTAADVVWSFEKLTELNPSQANYYADVVSVEAIGDYEVKFTFRTTGNIELPKIVGQIFVLPKHWWEGTDAEGNSRDISKSTLEPPLGSGPYRIEKFTAGRSITYSRVPDYWGANEPVNIGQNNFDTIRYEFFRDTTVQFEAFKGDQFDWWSENIARRWATGYDFAAVNEGRIIRERFENPFRASGIMVGFVPNLRRPQFADPLVREAINYAFDFEDLQRTIFFGEYERINSFFYRTDLASSGLPTGEELQILEEVRDLVPPEVFTTEYFTPVGGEPAKLRDNLRTALNLLNQAGYTLDGTTLVDKDGKQLEFEILLNGPTIESVALPFQANLAKIGIKVSVRSVDSPQYINRLRSRDFDMIYTGWGQSLSPGNEQRDIFGSAAAAQDSSRNYAGISDPGVDALVEKVIFADDRETLMAATRALDRTLMANHFVIPSYTATNSRIARWDRFSRPDELPEFSVGFPTVWWYDEQKAAAIAK